MYFHMIAAVILPMRRKTLNRQTNKPYETFGARYSDEILPTQCKQPNNNALIWSSIVILTFTLYYDKGRYLKMGFCLIGSTRIGWNQLQKISHSVNFEMDYKIVCDSNSDRIVGKLERLSFTSICKLDV